MIWSWPFPSGRSSQRSADVRYAWNKHVRLGTRAMGDGRFHLICHAYAIDLSLQGVGMVVNRQLAEDFKVVMEAPDATGQKHLLRVDLVFCAPILEGIYRVGGRFDLDA